MVNGEAREVNKVIISLFINNINGNITPHKMSLQHTSV